MKAAGFKQIKRKDTLQFYKTNFRRFTKKGAAQQSTCPVEKVDLASVSSKSDDSNSSTSHLFKNGMASTEGDTR
jgi:hypothetical protein